MKIGCTYPSRIHEVLTLYNVSCTAAVKKCISLSSADAMYRFPEQDLPKVFDKRKKSYLLSRHFRELANIVTLISLYDLYHTEQKLIQYSLFQRFFCQF